MASNILRGSALRTVAITALTCTLVFTSLGIYLLPRGIAYLAQRKLTNADHVTHEGRAPLNHISHVHRLATSDDKVIVRPNNDTFYSSAWMDLSKEAYLLSVPAMGERYYSLQFMDPWTNAFFYVGTRATGKAAGQFALVGPDWATPLPAGITPIRAPSNTVWIIGRTMVYGQDDVAAATALQEKITLTPLSQAALTQ